MKEWKAVNQAVSGPHRTVVHVLNSQNRASNTWALGNIFREFVIQQRGQISPRIESAVDSSLKEKFKNKPQNVQIDLQVTMC